MHKLQIILSILILGNKKEFLINKSQENSLNNILKICS